MTDKEVTEILTELPDRIGFIIMPLDRQYDYKEALNLSIKAFDKIYQIREITERALRSSDPINLYKARALDEIAEILGIELKAPAEDPDSKDQITIDDII